MCVCIYIYIYIYIKQLVCTHVFPCFVSKECLEAMAPLLPKAHLACSTQTWVSNIIHQKQTNKNPKTNQPTNQINKQKKNQAYL